MVIRNLDGPDTGIVGDGGVGHSIQAHDYHGAGLIHNASNQRYRVAGDAVVREVARVARQHHVHTLEGHGFADAIVLRQALGRHFLRRHGVHAEGGSVYCIALVARHVGHSDRRCVVAVCQCGGYQHRPVAHGIGRGAVHVSVNVHRHTGMGLGRAFNGGVALVGQTVIGGEAGVAGRSQGGRGTLRGNGIHCDGRHGGGCACVARCIHHSDHRNVAAVCQGVGHGE